MNFLFLFELFLLEKVMYLDCLISELNIWQVIGVIVIVIFYNEELFVLFGFYVKFMVGDIVYFIGNEYMLQCMINFFYLEYQFVE